jgi:large-conductance mechanosensitive channel
MSIKKLTSKIVDKIINEIQEPYNMNKLNIHILNPMINYTYDRIYPYFLAIIIVFLLTFILALMIFILLLRQTLTPLNI